MVLDLSVDQFGEVAEGLGGVKNLVMLGIDHAVVRNIKATHILHDTNSFLSLSNKFILSLLNLLLSFGAQLGLLMWSSSVLDRELKGVALSMSLDSIKRKSGLLNVLPRASGEHEVGVEGSVPPSKEALLDLGILSKTSLTYTLHGEGIFLETSGERVFAGTGMVLVESLAASQRSTGNGVAEGLGLGLRGWRGDEGSLGLLGAGGSGEESDLFGDSATKILEGFLDIGRIIVGLVGVLRAI